VSFSTIRNILFGTNIDGLTSPSISVSKNAHVGLIQIIHLCSRDDMAQKEKKQRKERGAKLKAKTKEKDGMKV